MARSLDAQPDHAPSLALRGAIALERGDARAAVADLERAAAIDRSAMTAWALRDALAAAGEHDAADQVHRSIVAEGARADARSLALYLASERIAPDRALALVRDELAVRSDALTLDALAWAQAAAGASDSAQISIERALAAGAGARLYYHAGSIAESRGDAQAALEWLDKAYQHKHTLLPSEKAGLFDSLCRLEAARC
ncbi:MAG: hypothetical protein E4H03_07905 [Myxococcales bacterium]|nr:MAG: hypothetical protein E4H03_07905 [Myxococcales bacterium]